ncbi:uncharacterized protein LOC128963980 [Oppia nitens]|uniref:uncharacterized protein LOC128963980 n=1 Tax=Oppia nitens TaxID=1686743 RepID=UPI0023DC423E|nr:uncharacterized protein LOC128963980 [Oppia nitens]
MPMELHVVDDDSDGSEPEEINVRTAKEAIKTSIAQQKNAIKNANDLLKKKRQLIDERNCQQKKAKQSVVDKLSDDVLNEITIGSKNPEIKTSDETSKDDTKQVSRKKKNKKKKSFKLITESTRFDVIDMNEDLKQMSSAVMTNKKSCVNFKDEMLYNRKRNHRISSKIHQFYTHKQRLSTNRK